MTSTALYRLYDAAGSLLYVGISADPEYRWKQHSWGADSSTWWPQVTRKAVEWFPNRDAAYEAETAAIKAEDPVHNRTMRPAGTFPAVRRRRSQEIQWVDRHLHSWSDQVAEILQREITDGMIQPGDLMPTGRQLYQRFGVTAQTCGKVLRTMAAQGWLHQNRKGGRYYCSERSSGAASLPLEDHLDKPEYKVFRFAVNRPAKAAAALRAAMTDEQLAALIAVLQSPESKAA